MWRWRFTARRCAFGSPTPTTRSGALTGVTGDGDPVAAVADDLVTFPAERIVSFTRLVSEQSYDEGVDAAAPRQRFGLPVQRAD